MLLVISVSVTSVVVKTNPDTKARLSGFNHRVSCRPPTSSDWSWPLECSGTSVTDSAHRHWGSRAVAMPPKGSVFSVYMFSSAFLNFAFLGCLPHWKKFANKCYFFSSERDFFANAKLFCESMSSHLVFINTEEEQVRVWHS